MEQFRLLAEFRVQEIFSCWISGFGNSGLDYWISAGFFLDFLDFSKGVRRFLSEMPLALISEADSQVPHKKL